MDLSKTYLATTYLGIQLPHPFMCGASPLADDPEQARRLEDAGAAAVTLHSLFEEEIRNEQYRETQDLAAAENLYAEHLTFHPHSEEYGEAIADDYLTLIRKVKEAVAIPVIASLNGVSLGRWVAYARHCRQAGADALELNMFFLSSDFSATAESVEDNMIEVIREVNRAAGIPLAVKLTPLFTSLPHLVKRIEKAGAKGVLLFNRFYQPDIDPENLEMMSTMQLSDSTELLPRLRWLAYLSGNVDLSLGITGGVHTAVDAIKAIMAGAHGVQMVSALLRNGPQHLTKIRQDVKDWMEAHGYESLTQMRGSMNQINSPDPGTLGRVNYRRILKGGNKYV